MKWTITSNKFLFFFEKMQSSKNIEFKLQTANVTTKKQYQDSTHIKPNQSMPRNKTSKWTIKQ